MNRTQKQFSLTGVSLNKANAYQLLDNATLVRRALPLLVGAVLMLTCVPSDALQVYGNGLLIPNGDLDPRRQDLTDFGTNSVDYCPRHTHTFTIVNNATNSVTVSLTMSELHPPYETDYFSYTLPLDPILASMESTTFTVSFLATAEMRHTANVIINPGGENYYFSVGGTGGPVATVYGNGKAIPNGNATPALSNHTDFGSAAIGSSVTRVYAITNASDCELAMNAGGGTNYVAITGPDAHVFTVLQQPIGVLPPGSGTTFQVRFTPDADTPFEAQASFLYDNRNESFTFTIAGTGSAADMAVAGKGVAVPSGSLLPRADNGTDFGEVPLAGAKATNDFTIQNTGALMLILTESPPVRVTGPRAADFTVTVQPTPNVASGTQTTFRLVFDPGATGACNATVSIGNNDPDENPYTFAVRGDGAVPEINLLGNGVSIPSGDSTPSTNDGTQFGPVRRGSSHTHTFTVWNYGGMTLVLTAAPPVRITGAAAADFVAGSIVTNIGPHSPEGFTVQFTPSTTGVRQATVSIPNTDTNESPYTFMIEGTGIAPKITVLGNATVIADEDFAPRVADGTDYGNVVVLRGVTARTFTIRNDGTDTLNLSEPYVTLSGLGAFTMVQLPATPIPVGNSRVFSVSFAPIATGSQTNKVRIFSDDPNEGSYDFAICGTGVTPHMAVNGNGQWIPTASQTPATANDTYFGGSICGSNHSHVFTVTNSGTLDLSLTGTPQMVFSGPATGDFAVTAWPASLVPVNHATNFTVRFQPTAGGLRAATVSIPSSDPQRDPYTFAMAGFGFQTLTNDAPVALSASPATNGFHFQSLTSGWSVIAVTPRSGNFDLDVSTNTSLTPMIAMSQQAGTNIDYALLNGHLQTASGARYAQVSGAAAGSYLVESEWAIPDLQIGQFYEGLHLGTNESVDLFEANLTALDDYYITLSRAATNAALTFYVFGPSHATAVVGDHDAFLSASGTNPTARLLYTPLESGWHAILVVDTSRRECDYALGVLSGPKMRLLGNGVAVTNNDATPSLMDNTDFGAGDVDAAGSPRLFVVENPGVGDLRLTSYPPVRITGALSNQFGVVSQPGSTIGPGSSANMVLAFAPNRCGLSTATVVIANNDPSANPFSITIQGRGFHRLVDEFPVAFSNTAEEFVFRSAAFTWAGLAVRAAPQDRTLLGTAVPDWSSVCVTSAVSGSATETILVAATGGATDHYARVSSGTTSNYIVDYQATAEWLTPGTPSPFMYGTNDVLALFSVSLNGGTEYYVAADPALGGETADMSLLVLRPDRRWGSRSDGDWSAQANGAGMRENVAFVAPVTGLYAVAVLQESRAAGYWWVVAARAVPDMLVLGNGSSIVNGSDTPSLANHTRFNDASTLGSSTRTFTIRNNGYKDLALGGNPRVSITGINAADFTVTQMPATNVTLRGGATTFIVTFRPRGRGVRQAQVAIANSQSDRTPFSFAISGYAIGPLMRVEGFGCDVPDGSLVPVTTNGTDFGARTAGAHTRERQFDILNAGEDMLGLTGSPPVVVTGPQAADFTVDASDLRTPLSAGGQTSFRIIFQPLAEGMREATVRIRCDDPERDPFEFAIRGQGVLPRITRLRYYPGNAVELRWDSLDETLYTIQSANRLEDGFTNRVQWNIPGDSDETTLSFPAPTNRAMFYRISVQP